MTPTTPPPPITHLRMLLHVNYWIVHLPIFYCWAISSSHQKSAVCNRFGYLAGNVSGTCKHHLMPCTCQGNQERWRTGGCCSGMAGPHRFQVFLKSAHKQYQQITFSKEAVKKQRTNCAVVIIIANSRHAMGLSRPLCPCSLRDSLDSLVQISKWS